MTSHPHALAPTRTGDLHRAAGELADQFPHIDMHTKVWRAQMGDDAWLSVRVTDVNDDPVGALRLIADTLGFDVRHEQLPLLRERYFGNGSHFGGQIYVYVEQSSVTR